MIEKTDVGLKFSNKAGDILHFYNDNSVFITNSYPNTTVPSSFAGFDFSQDEIDALYEWLTNKKENADNE